MKVLMIPTYEEITASSESGIKRVCEAYYKYLPKYGVEFVGKNDDSYDVLAVHAGITGKDCDVAILHGLYWSADYASEPWELQANKNIVQAVRSARKITVPSAWVAETIQRDLRVNPTVVPHGIVAAEWKHNYDHQGYVLWNKNRAADVCDPAAIASLAIKFPNTDFVTTFSPDQDIKNIHAVGHIDHARMKTMVQKAGVYLSTTKETFGIGILEAMASGVPVLGYRWGGNIDLIQHGVNGYLAEPNDKDDLIRGLEYCMQYRNILGRNGIQLAQSWTWDKPIELMFNVFKQAAVVQKPSVAVVIPTYNYGEKSKRAIDSVLHQSFKADEIIVVDDGSTDHPEIALRDYILSGQIKLIQKANGGVATARNRGIEEAKSKYICCLDADDAIDEDFLKVCVSELEADPALGIAYTRLRWVGKDGANGLSAWPAEFNFNRQLERANQIPTCCVFRREMWVRLGGYKQRYAPLGAGAEDAEFWLRAGAYGYNAKLVSDSPMFVYSVGEGAVSGNKNYHEVDWLSWHPWTKDKRHPFASLATPARISHPVRQYDRPAVSVIIPVGKGHENIIENALDSLEAQTMRSWEVIVVWDSPTHPSAVFKQYQAYPYIHWLKTDKAGSGPGVARNLGAKHARGGFILFLDADDWLMPEAIEKMMTAWQKDNAIVYSDYFGKISVGGQEDAEKFADRLVDFNSKSKEAVVRHYAAEFVCERAQRQPVSGELYHWCLVTCLIPKLWHDEIGGFDEKMESFEDVDYHWRMARKGRCYVRIAEPLVMYCFGTGNRRENASPYQEHSRQVAVRLLEYMLRKYEDIQTMPCYSCGQQPIDRPTYPGINTAVATERSAVLPNMADEMFVKIRYDHPNKGDHRVVGSATRIDYGYRAGGDIFLVHKEDVKAAPHLFTIVEPEPGKVFAPAAVAEMPAVPVAIETPSVTVSSEPIEVKPAEVYTPPVLDVYALPGITEHTAAEMKTAGIDTYEKIVALGIDGLVKIKGIGQSRAETLLKLAKEKTNAA